ncbi:hypothetical protein [Streptomyces sp. TRM68367]|uniref:hypothetical protein n=1 Tax=Streptomyces sp. TRM68367 TaxID=2758415 RepID=UPI00165C7E39|nr:hypothetical protein [Streptomyces sp. TRM68367]MBC9728057.1 hypothetical protein [Streptomyces sp. TRM68367]
MLRGTWTRGRRGVVVGASVAVVCLGGVLAACGSGGGSDPYVAVGVAGGPPQASGTAEPTGGVTFAPLDEAENGNRSGDGSGSGSGSGSNSVESERDPGAGGAESAPGAERRAGDGGGRGAPGGGGESPRTDDDETNSPRPGPSRTAPQELAALRVGEPERKAADKRWCEKVTLVFRNTGGTAVGSGTVTFETHVIGALGIDWATVESTERLPAPIAPGARKKQTWTVCVEEWRVPLGMHVETRDVSVEWR